MTVAQLMQILSQCKPDATVRLNLNASMVDRESIEADDGCEYSYTPAVGITWDRPECSGLADHLNIEMPRQSEV